MSNNTQRNYRLGAATDGAPLAPPPRTPGQVRLLLDRIYKGLNWRRPDVPFYEQQDATACSGLYYKETGKSNLVPFDVPHDGSCALHALIASISNATEIPRGGIRELRDFIAKSAREQYERDPGLLVILESAHTHTLGPVDEAVEVREEDLICDFDSFEGYERQMRGSSFLTEYEIGIVAEYFGLHVRMQKIRRSGTGRTFVLDAQINDEGKPEVEILNMMEEHYTALRHFSLATETTSLQGAQLSIEGQAFLSKWRISSDGPLVGATVIDGFHFDSIDGGNKRELFLKDLHAVDVNDEDDLDLALQEALLDQERNKTQQPRPDSEEAFSFRNKKQKSLPARTTPGALKKDVIRPPTVKKSVAFEDLATTAVPSTVLRSSRRVGGGLPAGSAPRLAERGAAVKKQTPKEISEVLLCFYCSIYYSSYHLRDYLL
jgi:hypothetical protein